MSRRRVSRSVGWLVGLLALFAAASASAQVDPKKPYETEKAVALPALPDASGPLADSPINKTTPYDVHEGVYTWGGDLVNPGTSKEQDWLNKIYPTPPGDFAFTASPNFILHLKDEALDSAKEYRNGLQASTIDAVFDLLEDFGASVQKPSSPKDFFFGYWPVRARWLKSQWAPTGQAFWMAEGKVNYADYYPFSDIRLRGARLYCAARRVQAVQGSDARSLGERVGFSVGVMGQQIDFLVIEPTVALDAPAKFPLPPWGEPDGAQAFSIPFQFGTRITPIRNIGLPSLGEGRVPVVLVTGDTEVKTASNKRQVTEIGKGGLVSQLVFSKEHQTDTHADAILSAGFHGDQMYQADASFPIFYIGALEVAATLGLGYQLGKPLLLTDRVLQGDPWVNTPRTGHLYDNPNGFLSYHDGAWLVAKKRASPYFEWQVQPDGSTNAFWTDPIVTLSPTDLRALTNDDHALATSTELGLSLGLAAVLGVEAGPFDVTAKVHGSFGGTVTQNHVLRDALMAEEPPPGFIPQMVPSTVVTVRPQQTAKVEFKGLTAGLHFHLSLPWPFDDISFDKTFFNVPGATLADYDSDDSWSKGDEAYMLRIGTGSASMTEPGVYSHLPGGDDFPTFVEDVSACLADDTPAPTLNPPCDPQPAIGQPPKVNVCVYGPSVSLIEKFGSKGVQLSTLPNNACSSSLGTWPTGFGITPAIRACFQSYVQLLCQQDSLQQVWQGQSVVSHVWDFDPAFGVALGAAVDQCLHAFQDAGVPIAPDETSAEFVSVGPCKDGLLIADDAIIQAINPTQAPKPKPGAACSAQ